MKCMRPDDPYKYLREKLKKATLLEACRCTYLPENNPVAPMLTGLSEVN